MAVYDDGRMVSDAATTEDALLWDGRYRLVRTLGEGGMGRVILGHDRLQGDRPVALKRLLPAFEAETPSFVREFLLRLASSYGFHHAPLTLRDFLTLQQSALFFPLRQWAMARVWPRTRAVGA